MEVRREKVGSPGYLACLELRRVVLREPLGLSWSDADLAQEENERQMGLWSGETLLACVSVRPLSGSVAKIRQMAVAAGHQQQGLGRFLLEAVIGQLTEEGMTTLELHSRETAVSFYAKHFGFERVGDVFEEVGLPHWKMIRKARHALL